MSSVQRPTKKDESPKSFASKIAVGVAVTVILYFVMLALYALFALKTGAGTAMYMPVGVFFGALSGLIGSFAAVRPIKQKGVLYGAVSALVSAIICSGVLFVVNGNKAGNGIFILMAAMLLGGAAGGVAAVNLKIKKKY